MRSDGQCGPHASAAVAEEVDDLWMRNPEDGGRDLHAIAIFAEASAASDLGIPGLTGPK